MGVRWLAWCASRRAPFPRQRALRAVSGLERIAYPPPGSSGGREDRRSARYELVRLAVAHLPASAAALGVMERSEDAADYLLAGCRSWDQLLANWSLQVLDSLGPDTSVEVREFLFRRVPDNKYALRTVRNHGWLPQGEDRHAWFLLFTGQWREYAELDPEGFLLPRTYLTAPKGDRWEMSWARRRFEAEATSDSLERARPLLRLFDDLDAEWEAALRRQRGRRGSARGGGARGGGARPSGQRPDRGDSGYRGSRDLPDWAEEVLKEALDAAVDRIAEADGGSGGQSGGSWGGHSGGSGSGGRDSDHGDHGGPDW